MAKQKYYVVWRGVVPGIYTTWAECEQQVKGVEGAVYKSFASRDEAEEAYYSAPEAYIKQKQTDGGKGVGEVSVAQLRLQTPLRRLLRQPLLLRFPIQFPLLCCICHQK